MKHIVIVKALIVVLVLALFPVKSIMATNYFRNMPTYAEIQDTRRQQEAARRQAEQERYEYGLQKQDRAYHREQELDERMRKDNAQKYADAQEAFMRDYARVMPMGGGSMPYLAQALRAMGDPSFNFRTVAIQGGNVVGEYRDGTIYTQPIESMAGFFGLVPVQDANGRRSLVPQGQKATAKR